MKHNFFLFGITTLVVTLVSSTTFGQKSDVKTNPGNSRHIKIVKIVDGKKMALDTVLTGNDVFVWKGDTIHPEEKADEFSLSGFKKLHRFDLEDNGNGEQENAMIYHQKMGKDNNPIIWQMESDDEDIDLAQADGDSTGEKIVIRKRIRDGKGDKMFYFNGPEMNHFPPAPPVPPVPPVPHFKMFRDIQSGRMIDLNDPDIISYKRRR